MRAVAAAVGCVVVVVASGCCCPCGYVGGIPDVAQQVRPELAPAAPVQAVAQAR